MKRLLCVSLALLLLLSSASVLQAKGESAAEAKSVSTYQIGDTVTFGAFEQDKNAANGKEPLVWRVLAKDNGGVTLLSEMALLGKEFNTSDRNVKWDYSTIRDWLNYDFMDEAFTTEEQAGILTVPLQNERNPQTYVDGGGNTQDRVFLLNIQEAEKYFNQDSQRKARLTQVAKSNAMDQGGYTWWWLRSPGKSNDMAAYVSDDGSIYYSGIKISSAMIAVRPAIRLSSVTLVTKAEQAKEESKTVKVEYKISTLDKPVLGTVVYLGKYEQDNNPENGKEDIPWRVLTIENTGILLVSEQNLDCRPYHRSDVEATWEASSLRKWLNNDFLNAAFSEEEQKRIALRTQANPDNEIIGKGGNNTSDKVFLLNVDEAERYFSNDKQRQAMSTAYAISQGAYDEEGYGEWWLRSPGMGYFFATTVSAKGLVNPIGYAYTTGHIAVRPAMWIQTGDSPVAYESLFNPGILKSLPQTHQKFDPKTLIGWASDKNNRETWDYTTTIYLNEHSKTDVWKFYASLRSTQRTDPLVEDTFFYAGLMGSKTSTTTPFITIAALVSKPIPVKKIIIEMGDIRYQFDFTRADKYYAISQKYNLRFDEHILRILIPLGSHGPDFLRDLYKFSGTIRCKIFYSSAESVQINFTKTKTHSYQYVYQCLIRSGYLDEYGNLGASVNYSQLDKLSKDSRLPKTEKLQAAAATVKPAATPKPTPDLSKYKTYRVGDKNDDILKIRTRLYELGYFKNKPTQTEFTQSMADYVKEFQKNNNINADGVLTPATQAALFSRDAKGKGSVKSGNLSTASSKYPQVDPYLDLVLTGNGQTGKSYGTPWVILQVKNIGSKTIDGYTLTYHCYDVYDNQMKSYGYGSVYNDEIITMTLAPGQTKSSSKVYLYGFDDASVLRIYISKVHFTDGTTVSLPFTEVDAIDAFSMYAQL